MPRHIPLCPIHTHYGPRHTPLWRKTQSKKVLQDKIWKWTLRLNRYGICLMDVNCDAISQRIPVFHLLICIQWKMVKHCFKNRIMWEFMHLNLKDWRLQSWISLIICAGADGANNDYIKPSTMVKVDESIPPRCVS